MPLTVGGGIRTVDDVRALLQVGADKVAISTAASTIPTSSRGIADRFGSQCVVVSIDARRRADGAHEVFTGPARGRPGAIRSTSRDEVEALGAGEILLTSIERDGTMTGYDVDLVARCQPAVSIPVIASGGAGSYEHMVEVLREGASAVAAASMFHFTEQTPLEAKQSFARRRASTCGCSTIRRARSNKRWESNRENRQRARGWSSSGRVSSVTRTSIATPRAGDDPRSVLAGDPGGVPGAHGAGGRLQRRARTCAGSPKTLSPADVYGIDINQKAIDQICTATCRA